MAQQRATSKYRRKFSQSEREIPVAQARTTGRSLPSSFVDFWHSTRDESHRLCPFGSQLPKGLETNGGAAITRSAPENNVADGAIESHTPPNGVFYAKDYLGFLVIGIQSRKVVERPFSNERKSIQFILA